MRRSILTGLAIGVMVLLVTAVPTLATMSLDLTRGTSWSAVRMVDTRLDLSALPHGLLVWEGEYAAPMDPLATWHALPRLAKMQLEEGVRSTDPCLRLVKVEAFHAFQRATAVKLCAERAGTRIYVNQRLSVRP